MFEAIAYYDNRCWKINLERILEFYKSGDLPKAAENNIQYAKKAGSLVEVLKGFAPTPHILVWWIDNATGKAELWDEFQVQEILNMVHPKEKAA